jgi:hypothetical protein
MKTRFTKTITAVIIVLALISTAPTCLAQNHNVTYQLLDEQDGNAGYSLNVVVPQTLLDYYEEKRHQIYSSNDFSRFVTPYALKPIADILMEIYTGEEDFANGALMIVHQMTYVETVQGKFPAETMVDNKGDCDLFSFVAASIMQAAGLDVVLLYYEERKHMNIGVHLSKPPEDAREGAYKITSDDIQYYIAECTGANWTIGWRVGECPDNLKQAKAQVITLEDSEQIAPGQVSASFTMLEPSDVSLGISSLIAFEESIITFRGHLTPTKPNENVTIYMGVSGSHWTILGTAVTQPDGNFAYSWRTADAGLYSVRASWSGDETYAGATSATKTGTVIPVFLGVLIGIVVLAIIIGAVAVLASKHTRHENLEPKEPQPPTFS